MLRSNLFFSPAAYRQRIKSPVEYALGIARAMEQIVPTLPLGHDLDGLGQGLYEPPGAKGWAGGQAWINAATMLARNKLAGPSFPARAATAKRSIPRPWRANMVVHCDGAACRFFADLLLQGDVEPAVAANDPDAKDALRRAAYAVTARPEFQLA